MRLLAVIISLGLGCLWGACEGGKPENVSFAGDIKPILRRSCTPCHNSVSPQGNIDLTSYTALMESRYYTRREPIALPGNSHDSRLYIVVTTRRDGFRMPPEDSNLRRISEREAEIIRVWIEEGARDN
jgi:hypothetical protein